MRADPNDPAPGDGAQRGRQETEPAHWLSRVLLACLVLAAVAVLASRAGSGAPRQRGAGSPKPAPPAPVVISLGHRLLGVTADWVLFARGPDDVVSLSLASGRITITAVPPLQSANPDVTFLIGPHEVVVRSSDLVPGYLIPDGAAARRLAGPLAVAGSVITGPDPRHAWVTSGTASRPSLTLVGLDGQPAGTYIRLPPGAAQLAETAVPDGRGYVLLRTIAFGLYDAGPTWDRPVPGDLLATGPTRWLAVVCDTPYRRCHNEVTNPASGARWQLPGPALAVGYGRTWPPAGVVSPDGATAAVPVTGSGGIVILHLINLTSGADVPVSVRLADSPGTECMTWSPDSAWLFVAARDGRLLAVNARSHQVRAIGVSLPSLTQVAVRDAPA